MHAPRSTTPSISPHPLSRRLSILAVLLLGPFLLAACEVAVSPSPGALAPEAAQASPPGKGQFLVQCREPVSSKADDPIVAPGRPGAAHNHEFYGNRSADAHSTAASLAGRPTGCDHGHKGGEPGDTASYWHPTLYVSGKRLPAPKSTFYYTNRGNRRVERAFPAGLKVIAGNHRATAPQGTDVVYWGCGSGTSSSKVERPPQCPKGTDLQVHVLFPDCWNGRDLDSPDHKSHMAYSAKSGGAYRCPSSHPVSVPTLIMRIMWSDATPAPATLRLASGPVDTMHADFFNSWNQARLDQLVEECIVAERDCDYEDVDALPFPAPGSPSSPPPTTPPTSTTLPGPTTTTPQHPGPATSTTPHPPAPTTAPSPPPTPPPPTPAPPTANPPPPGPTSGEVLPGGDFESTLAGWRSADGSQLRHSADSHGGQRSALVTRTDSGSGHARLMDDPAADPTMSGACAATAWVKGPAGRSAKIRLREYHGGDEAGRASTEVVLGSGWQLLEVGLLAGGGNPGLDVYLQDAPTGEALLVDDVSLRCR